MKKTSRKVSATQLHEILEREFRATAADLCTGCAVPKPVFFERAGEGANWRLPPLAECNALCHTILQDIAEKLSREYDMAPPRSSHPGEPIGPVARVNDAFPRRVAWNPPRKA